MVSVDDLSMQVVMPNTNPGAQYQTPARKFQGIPGIEVTPRGRLWATWYSGEEGEKPDNFVLLVNSTDGGETWSEPVLVIDPPERVRAYDPTLWMDPCGRLWLFWSQCEPAPSGGIFDGRAGVWEIHTEDPESDSPSWSTPRRIANGVMMNKPTALRNGEWAFPTAVWDNHAGGPVPDELLPEKASSITVTADEGETFTYRGGAQVPDRHFDEHMIVEKNDGRLWMLVRTFYGVGESFSDDGGRTWSPGEDSGIPGPNSRFFIRRLASGRLLMVNHDVPKEGERVRERMTAWLSEDDGQSWQGGLLLDPRSNVSYPDGTQDAGGNIYIIYDHERYVHGDIMLARFREEDVLSGKVKSEGSFLQRVVNHSGGVPEKTG